MLLSPMSCLLTLEFSEDPYLENLPFHIGFFFFFAMSTISYMISLTGSVVNTLKSYLDSFLQQEFIVLSLMTFMAFSITKMVFSMV